MLPGLTLNAERVESLAGESGMLAPTWPTTWWARGCRSREAHGIMRELCRHCDEQGIGLQDLPIAEYHKYSPLFQAMCTRSPRSPLRRPAMFRGHGSKPGGRGTCEG